MVQILDMLSLNLSLDAIAPIANTKFGAHGRLERITHQQFFDKSQIPGSELEQKCDHSRDDPTALGPRDLGHLKRPEGVPNGAHKSPSQGL